MAHVATIEGESVLTSWSSIVLTTHRVIGPSADSGQASLALDRVEWAGIQHRHHPHYLWVAILLAALGVALWNVQGVGLGVLAMFAVVFYFATRSTAVVVGAGGGRVTETVRTSERDGAISFCRIVVAEAARLRRH